MLGPSELDTKPLRLIVGLVLWFSVQLQLSRCKYNSLGRRGNVTAFDTTVVTGFPGAAHGTGALETCDFGPLPSSDLLVRAARGHRVVGGQLLWYARDAAIVHERRLVGRGGSMVTEPVLLLAIERRRLELVMAIDDWVARNVPQHRLGATLHTETIGAVIDRLAEASVKAHHALMTLDSDDDMLHSAWHHLAELADAYDDLVRDVRAGRRRLPEW